MHKILAAFDGLKYSNSTRDHVIAMAKKEDVHVVGVFLEDPTYHSYKIYELVAGDGGLYTRRKHLEKKDEKTRAMAVTNFEKAFKLAGISHAVHKDRHTAIRDLLKESIYADLLIIDSSENLAHHAEELPTRFIHELLPDVQCPVMLVPHQYKAIDRVVLLFDGSPASVQAIKMLSYTIPSFGQYQVDVLTVNQPKQKVHWPDGQLMKEFMKRHYPAAKFTALRGDPESEIVDFLKKQGGYPLVALGAYRRGKVSRWFKSSMADILMKKVNFPLFIAHQ